MPGHAKPRFEFPYNVADERQALRDHARERGIPKRSRTRLLIATWNIANLGVQERRKSDYQLLAEVCSWFDLIAVQEVNDDLEGLRGLQAELGDGYRVLFSDASGNQERQAFIYDPDKVELLEKVGRLSIPPSQLKSIKIPGSSQPFQGFDRGPYLAAFSAGSFQFLLINVHLYFGSDAATHIQRRALETFAVAWWAQRRQASDNAFTKDIIPLGDFNLPKISADDPIHTTLTSRGLELGRVVRGLKDRGLALPEDENARLSAIGGSSLDGLKHYDQVAFFPGETPELERVEVFDFDRAIFKDLFETRELSQFLAYLRYYVSDHRPLWAEFSVAT